MNKWIKVAIFLTVCVLIMPMLSQNDIVQTIKASSDMQAHTSVIRAVSNGEQANTLYYGQVILAYIMKPLANSGKLDAIYLWWNFVMLIVSAFALQYVVGKLTGNKSALLVVPVAMFCATGILALFKYGVIFNIVNMYVILPFAIYFAVKWLDNKGWWYLSFAVVLFALFSLFHYTAVYLPYVVGCSIAIYIAYAFIRHNTKPLLKVVSFAVGLVAMNVMLSSVFLSREYQTTPTPLSPSFHLLGLLVRHLSATTVPLFCLAVCGLIAWRKEIQIDSQGRIWLLVLGSFGVALLGGLLTSAISDLNRVAIDLATMIAIATASMLGLVMQNKLHTVFDMMVILLVAGGSIPTLISLVR